MLLLTLLACPPSSEKPTSCPDTTATAVAACFASPLGADTASGTLSFDAIGTVVEVGTGFADACDGARLGTEPSAAGWSARLDTADGDVWIGIDTPGSTAPIVGAVLTVRGTYEPADFGPTQAYLQVSESDALQAWVGTAGTAEELVAPEGYGFDRGDAVCTDEDDCGEWEEYDTRVTVDSAVVVDGASTTVPEAVPTAVGSLTVTVAENELSQDPDVGCPDWFVANTLVGMGR